jgi:hypothetical protein
MDPVDLETIEFTKEDQDMAQAARTLVAGPKGQLAREYGGESLPLQVLQSARGHYLGTVLDDAPYTRESNEYWPTKDQAEHAMAIGEDAWTQRDHL